MLSIRTSSLAGSTWFCCPGVEKKVKRETRFTQLVPEIWRV
jgi:hypothetical protein